MTSRQAIRSNTSRKLALVCLIAVYLLILIGSSVRATGSGMGCPDWPTCFGKLIPPIEESQLPSDYQKIYADYGYANQPFNVAKTWTEFGNRLASTIVGLLVFSLFIHTLFFLRKTKLIFISLSILIITGIQGWLGAIVVSSNLHPLMVSTHMLFALVIVACLHAFIENSRNAVRNNALSSPRLILFASALLLLIQIAVGLNLREQIDYAGIIFGNQQRALWIESLGDTLSSHIILASSIATLAIYMKIRYNTYLYKLLAPLPNLWLISLLGSILSGILMWLIAIPAYLQPLHLLFASLQFGLLFHIIFRMLRSQSPQAIKIS